VIDARLGPQSAAAEPDPPRTRQSIDVYDISLAGDDPAALIRLLVMLRRRRCAVLEIQFQARDLHRPGHLTLCVQPSIGATHTVATWLAAHVDVLDVRKR